MGVGDQGCCCFVLFLCFFWGGVRVDENVNEGLKLL